MDLLLILRDALASSLVGGLLTAIEAKKAGQEVGIVFTQEALAALARGSFGWPRALSGQEMRLLMADRAAAAGLPLLGKGEGRQLDAKALVARAAEAGVRLYACPLWTSLLGLEGALPGALETLDTAGFLGLVRDARKVIGSL
jgi:peroxiredoxin family protein